VKRLLCLAILLLAACPSDPPEPTDDFCDSGQTHAQNPASGECVAFDSPCDVPAEWSGCPGAMFVCSADDQCQLTQHCSTPDDGAPPACVDNPVCQGEDDCGVGERCDLDARADLDPTMPEGLCARDIGTPAPPAGCVSNAECGERQICPAQYGGCSSEAPPDGASCPSQCEAACLLDEECGDPLLVCNAPVICGVSNGGGRNDMPLECAGWCVTK
jgi:hypothetical protein